MKSKTLRILAFILLGLLLLVIGTITAGALAKANLARQYPPPGELVDVAGHKMHLNCTGQGSPTVILEAGLAEFSVNWSKVQPQAANLTRVCSYDRAGYGWSERSPEPRSGMSEVEELHALLANAGIEGPYVLVGHSLGGMLMRLFARSYPDEVAGMALVDTANIEQNDRRLAVLPDLVEDTKRETDQLFGQFRSLAFLKSTGVMSFVLQSIPDPGLPAAALAEYRARLATGWFFETVIAEQTALDETLAQARAVDITDFGELPLIVLSAGVAEPNPNFTAVENQRDWEVLQALQAELVQGSAAGKQVIAGQSGHHIELEQPELVVGAVQELVEKSRE